MFHEDILIVYRKSYPNKRYINGKLVYSAIIWCIVIKFKNFTLTTGFVVKGHK